MRFLTSAASASEDRLLGALLKDLDLGQTPKGPQNVKKRLNDLLLDTTYVETNIARDANISGLFARAEIALERTFSTDDILIGNIVGELKHRSPFELAPMPDKIMNSKFDIALVSEWDTVYGQSIMDTVSAKLTSGFYTGCQTSPVDGCSHIHRETYLRGLDGQLPVHEEKWDQKPDGSVSTESKENTAVTFFQTSAEHERRERPVGQGQFDYLRKGLAMNWTR